MHLLKDAFSTHMTLSDRVRELADKLHEVSERMQQLLQENRTLKASNDDLKERLEYALAALEEVHVHQAGGESQVVKGVDSRQPEPAHELREKIEQYIAEIDECIDWLRNN
jgi:regulator of replication initiation timing